MTTQTQAEFFQAHAVDNQLTPEQMAEMLNLPEGDISIAFPATGKPVAVSGASRVEVIMPRSSWS